MPCSRAVEKRHFDAFGRLQVVDIFEEAVQGITTVDASVSAEAALCMRDGEMACDQGDAGIIGQLPYRHQLPGEVGCAWLCPLGATRSEIPLFIERHAATGLGFLYIPCVGEGCCGKVLY